MDELERLKKEIAEHNIKYYSENNPTIPDGIYDMLVKRVEELESQLGLPSSHLVGAEPSKEFEPFEHRVPMLSLQNANSEDDIVKFFKRTNHS